MLSWNCVETPWQWDSGLWQEDVLPSWMSRAATVTSSLEVALLTRAYLSAGCRPFLLGVSAFHGVSAMEIIVCVLLSQAQG